MSNHILYECQDRIATVTLNRPERLNAVSRPMVDEFIEALRRADRDDEVRVIIVTGVGRGFCAGADLEREDPFESTGDGASSLETHRDGVGVFSLSVYELRKPVIAAINGPAVGFGATLTLPMDIRIASENAKFGFAFEAVTRFALHRGDAELQHAKEAAATDVHELPEARRAGRGHGGANAASPPVDFHVG